MIPPPTLALPAPLPSPPVDAAATPCTIVNLPPTKSSLLVLDLPDIDGDVEEGEEESEEEGGDWSSSQDVKLRLELALLLLSPELGITPVEGEDTTSLESKALRASLIRLGEVGGGDGIDGEEEEEEMGMIV